VGRMVPTRMRPWNRALDTHHAHQTLHPLTIDHMALTYQPACYLPTAITRSAQILFVYQAHKLQVLLGLDCAGHAVITRTTQTDQRALPLNAQLRMLRLDEATPMLHRTQPTLFFSQSNSIFKRPISSYRDAVSAASRAGFGVDLPCLKASTKLSIACFFQALI